ncbi:HD domain-containing protein [Candidatus Tisiphia endosymbiont of Myopa tessellatipennis]|uniref:HD domain-containing protein n=1 Tax=Candidatus Tisiphia endosymbiont of Myopa tessellatipennis TaxID=3066257 RepID=UPI00313BBCB3
MEEEEINYWDNSKYAPCQYATRLLDKLRKMNEEVNRPIDIDEVRKAIYYAKKYHGSQMRQSGEPYYSHPLEVAYMISDYLFRTDIIVTSILHDTIEDTELTEKMIAYIFGEQVASQVEDLSRNKPHDKISSAETLDILLQQEKYDVALIKLFDRVHNLQTLGVKSPEKARKIIEETIQEFLVLSTYLGLSEIKYQLMELCSKYSTVTYPSTLDLYSLLSMDNFQPLLPIFQNDADQKCTLQLMVSL